MRECQHIRPQGTMCGSPAMRKKDYCYFHHQQRERRRRMNVNPSVSIPLLENGAAVQVALMNVIDRLNTKTIDHRSASLMLYGLQVASANLKRVHFGNKYDMVISAPEEEEPQLILEPITPEMREALGGTDDLPPGDPRLDKFIVKNPFAGDAEKHG